MTQTPAEETHDDVELALARQVAAARQTRDGIAETLDADGNTALAWLYRSVHL